MWPGVGKKVFRVNFIDTLFIDTVFTVVVLMVAMVAAVVVRRNQDNQNIQGSQGSVRFEHTVGNRDENICSARTSKKAPRLGWG